MQIIDKVKVGKGDFLYNEILLENNNFIFYVNKMSNLFLFCSKRYILTLVFIKLDCSFYLTNLLIFILFSILSFECMEESFFLNF